MNREENFLVILAAKQSVMCSFGVRRSTVHGQIEQFKITILFSVIYGQVFIAELLICCD